MPRYCIGCGASSRFSGGSSIEVLGLCVSCYNRELHQSLETVEAEIKDLITDAEHNMEFVEDDILARLSKWQRQMAS